MVTAHGTSERTLARLALGLTAIEATCPLVRVAHRAVTALAARVTTSSSSVNATTSRYTGLTRDLDRFDVVLDEHDVLALEDHPRLRVAAQRRSLSRRCGTWSHRSAGDSRDRTCGSLTPSPGPPRNGGSTSSRNGAQADVVIVSWPVDRRRGANSCRTCARYCACVHHMETEASHPAESVGAVQVVGLTAGTSTPDRDHRPRRGAHSPFAEGSVRTPGRSTRYRCTRTSTRSVVDGTASLGLPLDMGEDGEPRRFRSAVSPVDSFCPRSRVHVVSLGVHPPCARDLNALTLCAA